jgi:hypothetical protein
MFVFGTKRAFELRQLMSAFGGKADTAFCGANVRLLPKADIKGLEIQGIFMVRVRAD